MTKLQSVAVNCAVVAVLLFGLYMLEHIGEEPGEADQWRLAILWYVVFAAGGAGAFLAWLFRVRNKN